MKRTNIVSRIFSRNKVKDNDEETPHIEQEYIRLDSPPKPKKSRIKKVNQKKPAKVKVKPKVKRKYVRKKPATKLKIVTSIKPKKAIRSIRTEPALIRAITPKYSQLSHQEDRILMALSEGLSSKEGKSKTPEVGALDKRASFKNLQFAYSVDENAFRCVNFYAEKVVGPRFDLIGSSKEARDVLWDFIHKSELFIKLEDVARDMCISGNAYWEPTKFGKEIKGIKRLDFRFIDYIRNTYGRVKLDEGNVNPVGYVFGKMPFTNSSILISEVTYNPNELIHFKLYSSGVDLAYGYIEPIYGLIKFKRNIWSGLAQAAYNIGHRPIIIKHGDPPNPNTGYTGHKPTIKERDQIEGEFQDMETKDAFSMPYWIDVKQLEATTAEAQSELITKCNIGIAISFGLPPEMVGETKGNKAIIDTLITRDVNESIKAIQNKIANKLETELFPLILSQNNLNADDVPKIVWNEIAPPDKNRMAKRLNDYVDSGILRAEDVRDMVLKSEGLVKEEDLEKTGIGRELLDIIRDGGITVQEAIVFLQNLKKSFPDSELGIYVDKLIEKIMSKDTAPEKPKEVNDVPASVRSDEDNQDSDNTLGV